MNNIALGKSKFPGAGLGVFALKPFKKGEIVEHAPYIEIQDSSIPDTNLIRTYLFSSHKDDTAIITFGYGSMYNHSANPNLIYKYSDKHDRLMNFIANKDIKPYQELTIDYGKNHYVNK